MRKLRLALLMSAVIGLCGQSVRADDLDFSLWQYNEPELGQWWKSVVDKYQADTGSTVNIRDLPVNDYFSQLIIELANKSAADVVLVSGFYLPEYAAGGHLLPLDDLIGKSPVKDEIEEGGWDATRVDGKIYAVPLAGRTLEMIYNKCQFDEAGIAAPPTTLEEWYQAAVKLTKRGENGKVERYGASMVNALEDPTYEMLLMLSIAYGAEHFSTRDGKWQLTSEPVVKALDFMKKLYDEELIPRGLAESDQRSLFATGKSATMIDGQWQFPFIKETNAANYDCYKSAKHPWSGPATGGPNTMLAISASTDAPEAAWKFIELVASPEFQGTFGNYSPIIPLGKDAITKEQIAERPYLGPWIESIAGARQVPPPGHEQQMSQVWPIIAEAIVAALQEGMPARDALAKAQQQLEDCCG